MRHNATHYRIPTGNCGSVAPQVGKRSLTAFDAIVVNIADRPADQITKKAIIEAEEFNMKFSNGVIYYVEQH